MNIEIHFEENKERRMNSYDFSGSPFYPEISSNKEIDERSDKWMISYDTISNLYGSAIYYTCIDADGKMWVGNGEYESQVNYCPITGKKAKIKIEEPNIEEQ